MAIYPYFSLLFLCEVLAPRSESEEPGQEFFDEREFHIPRNLEAPTTECLLDDALVSLRLKPLNKPCWPQALCLY